MTREYFRKSEITVTKNTTSINYVKEVRWRVYVSKSFEGFGMMVNTNGPCVFRGEKNKSIEVRLFYFVYWKVVRAYNPYT